MSAISIASLNSPTCSLRDRAYLDGHFQSRWSLIHSVFCGCNRDCTPEPPTSRKRTESTSGVIGIL
ncbi:hypothetical protein FRC11_002500, partial [Ceratobasidium sp. 423]